MPVLGINNFRLISSVHSSLIQRSIRLGRSLFTKPHKTPTHYRANARYRHLRRADLDSRFAWQRQIDHGQRLGLEGLLPL